MKKVTLKNFDNLVQKFQDNDGLHNVVVNIQVASEIQCNYNFKPAICAHGIDEYAPYCLGVFCGLNLYVDPLKIWDDLTIIFINDIKEYEDNYTVISRSKRNV